MLECRIFCLEFGSGESDGNELTPVTAQILQTLGTIGTNTGTNSPPHQTSHFFTFSH